MFVGASAQITGTSHGAEGVPCQDRAASWMSEDGNVGIIVLCDGAGSCSSSEIGAELLCNWFPNWVDSRDDWWSLRPKEIPGALVPAIREQLEAEAAARSITFRSLSSTFLAVSARRGGNELTYRILHLGDGVAACISRDGKVVVSEPDNSEFANETVFTTSKSALSSLRVTEGTLPLGSGFVLMSDGGAASLYLKRKTALAPATAEMLRWLNSYDSDIVSAAIMENMKALFRDKTSDDCSIALLLDRCSICPFCVELEHPQTADESGIAAFD